MTILDARPDPQTVSHEAVASVARQRAAGLFEDLLLRDAKIGEQQAYIEQLEARVRELEGQLGHGATGTTPHTADLAV